MFWLSKNELFIRMEKLNQLIPLHWRFESLQMKKTYISYTAYTKIFNKEMEHQDNPSSSFSVTEVLLKNITQPISIALITRDTFTINSLARSYQEYLNI